MLALLPWTLLSKSSLGIFLLASDALMLLHYWLSVDKSILSDEVLA